jgi:hypothetical protein
MDDLVNRHQSGPERRDVRVAEHRTLQGLEPIDLAFGLVIAPGLEDRVGDCVNVGHQGSRNIDDGRDGAVVLPLVGV